MNTAQLPTLSGSVHPESHPQSTLLKKLHTVSPKQDLTHHCQSLQPGIDVMEFQKVVDLPGLLGEQVFFAMDTDQDGVLGYEEFERNIYWLCKGTEREQFRVLFEVMDFGGKGFVGWNDVRMISQALPPVCPKCDQPTYHHLDVNSLLFDMFKSTATFSFEALYDIRLRYESFFMDLLRSIITALPAVILDVLQIDDKWICENAVERKIEGKMPLGYNGKIRYFALQSECLFGYESAISNKLKNVICMKGLFVNPVNETEFELKNCSAVYHFTADSEETRDKWVEEIMTSKKYRWFDDFYEAGEVIGTGGQAKVLYGVSRGSRQPVAVKIVSKEGLDSKNELRIRREISILKSTSHPNLLHLYDVFETTERIYIVTEVLNEGTLFTHLEDTQFRIPESFAKSMISDIATALLYLHSHGIIHRDIKLENIMLRKDKIGHLEAVLIDFGLSCFLGPEQYSTEPVGTLKYAAPEVLSRFPYGNKADCWSLGVILYILLVGKMPFYGKNDQSIAAKILGRNINITSERWQRISSEGRAVLLGLLSRKAENRWSLKDFLSSNWLKEGVTDPGPAPTPINSDIQAEIVV